MIAAIYTILTYMLYNLFCLFSRFQKNPTQRELCTEPAHIYVEYGAELFFICPHVFLDVSQSEKRLTRETIYENIHLVNKDGFDSCKIDRSNSLLVECDKSSNVNLLKYEQVTFSRVNWNGWVFLPNNTYYFISKFLQQGQI